MAAFANVGELEAFMGSGLLGARGTAMLDHASATIRSYAGQDLDAVAGRQEEFAGAFRQILQLTETPVSAVSAITIDTVVFTDFVWDRWGTIHKSTWDWWDTGPIVVTYDSGFASTEDEFLAIKAVCLEVAARALGGPQSGGFEAFGSEVAELRGAAPGVFLTEGEKQQITQHLQVAVG